MGSKWANKSLKELGVQLIDCVHKTPSAQTHGIPYIGIPQMKNGELDFEASPRLISEADYKLWTEKVNPQRGDIVLSRRCNPGETAYVSDNTKFALGQNLVLLRTTGNLIKPEYLRWVVNSTYWWNEVEKYKNPGAIFDSLKCCDIPNFKIPAPPLHIQDKISYILGSLTDKINLNNKYNHTLEKMSQTLFKSWFVDFDPVIDNALDAGNPIPEALQSRAELRQKVRNSADFKPLPAEIRSLFPSEFEETELGWVPKTWTISNLGKEFNITMGQSPSGSTYNEDRVGLPFFQGKTDFGFRFPSERIYCTDPKRVANKLDTLLSVRAPVGVTNLASTECIIGRGLAALRHKSGNIAFTYYSVSNLSDYFSVFNGEGTVFGSINQKDLKQLPLICSPTELINKFEELSGKWEEKIFLHCGEIENLSKLRDTLLPKLISGELSLEDLPDLTTDTEAA
ncbi:TPA: restriction endonuclease subunit S [Escherichia coli]|uniref:restriction endonuclease subunit S n=1 Tax=Escherichia TaxID=561 RepID=UPI00045031FF|nr:type I restriction modification DNA specificity domain protein [Escherichia coli 1-176-05_S3_C2]WGM54386.1 restriction endonuclease subunit S [Escherichia ruysiae]HAL9676491.1 restriction endonuclease subunit S [Escherichia coli]HAV7814308.1 restriction endonuclease subunit S [Escherichia coli]HAW5067512.1 restriction endonuclease subunit S [Escherichia coli]